MHELAICQSMLAQVEDVARAHGARRVSLIRLGIGPLAGVEIPLLASAFTIARSGTVADDAVLDVESLPLRVRCNACGAESDATMNDLTCRSCGAWTTRVVSGDEMLLLSVELEHDEEATNHV